MVDCKLQKQILERNIPEEIVTEILKRLPVRCLLRFRSVSKSWSHLIRSPYFVNIHMKHQKSNEEEEDYILVVRSRYILRNVNVVVSFYSLGLLPRDSPAGFPVFTHSSRLDVCQPCNGIICLVTDLDFACRNRADKSSQGPIYLWNPATRECRKLPPRPFENNVKRVACGFGLDPRTDAAYKVVSVMFYNDINHTSHYSGVDYYVSGIYQIEIYDVSANSWREVEMVLPPDNIPDLTRAYMGFQGAGVLFKGCLHWHFSGNIIGFDLSDEVLRNLGRYDKSVKTVWVSRLMVVEDYLARVDTDYKGLISVFVMQDYGDEDSWVERYRFGPVVDNLQIIPLTALPSHGILFDDCTGSGDIVSCNLSGNDCHKPPLPCHHRRDDADDTVTLGAIVVSGQTLVSIKP